VCIVDRNQLGIDGPTEEIMSAEPIDDRFRAFGWNVQRINGHDLGQIVGAFDALATADSSTPQVVIADTIKGKGVKRMELDVNWHVGNLNDTDYEAVYEELVQGAGL
jgi:transketolase